jgi:hypothetical protein
MFCQRAAGEGDMNMYPKQQRDLLLAPIAAEIDLNLQRLRGKSPHDVGVELELELDKPALGIDRDVRTKLVLRQALRDVELHGWSAAITDDFSSVHLDGGSVSLDLGLGAAVGEYIREGVRA